MSGCVVKFRGAHIQHGYLKAGIAVLPAESERSYARHYVPKPVIPEEGYPGAVDGRGIPLDESDFRAWLSSLPTRMELNPVFVHFIRISPTTTLPQLEAELQRVLTPDVLTSADAFLSDRTKTERRSSSRFRKLMQPRERLGSGLVLPKGYDVSSLIAKANQRFKGLFGELDAQGKILPVEPGTIDIGAEATDRSGNGGIWDNTIVNSANPANASGVLTYCEIFLLSGYPGVDVWVGTFSASGNVLTCRDSESIGAVSSGSKQTASGLDIDVLLGDYFGAHDKGPSGTAVIERDATGGPGYWLYVGECIDSSDSETFNWSANRVMSLYGEGEEGATEKESSDTGTGTDTVESLETPEAKTSSDAGAGAEGAPTASATLAGSESGSGIEALISRLLADDESGGATEASDVEGEEGSKDLSADEPAEGADRLVAKIEMPTKGGGMKLWI
jgi:hypothetical protein